MLYAATWSYGPALAPRSLTVVFRPPATCELRRSTERVTRLLPNNRFNIKELSERKVEEPRISSLKYPRLRVMHLPKNKKLLWLLHESLREWALSWWGWRVLAPEYFPYDHQQLTRGGGVCFNKQKLKIKTRGVRIVRSAWGFRPRIIWQNMYSTLIKGSRNDPP